MWIKSSRCDTNGCIEVDRNWVKSSRSMANGDCVEVNRSWRKSSRCDNNLCVEVALGDQDCGQVAVRDSKDPEGDILVFDSTDWMKFLNSLPAKVG